MVKGSFTYNGTNYSYAMYYTSYCDALNGNAIGVAFSNNGINWVKYANNPIIVPQWSDDGYGAGQAQVYNTDGGSSLWLFHTDVGDGGGNRMYRRTTTDGITFSSPVQVIDTGSSNMAGTGMVYDSSTDKWYLFVGTENNAYGPIAQGLYTIPTAGLFTGSWTKIASMPSEFVKTYQFEGGIKTDIYGDIASLLPYVWVGFCGSNYYRDNIYEWELYQGMVDVSYTPPSVDTMYTVNGTDLSDILAARSTTKIADVNYAANGTDLSNTYEKLSSGDAPAITNFQKGGADFNTLFCKK